MEAGAGTSRAMGVTPMAAEAMAEEGLTMVVMGVVEVMVAMEEVVA